MHRQYVERRRCPPITIDRLASCTLWTVDLCARAFDEREFPGLRHLDFDITMSASLGNLFKCAWIPFGPSFRRRRRRQRERADRARSTVNRKVLDARESERAWLARELHDDIAQRLFLVLINLENLKDGHTSVDDLRHAIEQISTLNTDIQRLSRRLHSSKVELLGLAAAAAGHCGEVSAQYKVQIDLHAEDIPRELPAETSLSIFRVLQEALQNAIKHSGSPRFEVLVSHDSDSNEIHLTVRDFGKGFDATQAMRGRGLGLASMTERVTLVGGDLSINSQPQKGTTVHVRVPLRTEAGPRA